MQCGHRGEASAELSQRRAGVHQGGGIRHKIQPGEGVEKRLLPLRYRSAMAKPPFGLGNTVGHTSAQVLWRFQHLSTAIAAQIACLENCQGIVGQLQHHASPKGHRGCQPVLGAPGWPEPGTT
jgi:hypothetical protein